MMTYFVLNKKTSKFIKCDGVDAAWNIMTDVLMDHYSRADIDILSVEDGNVKSPEAFAEMLAETLPEEVSPFPQSPDDCYIAVNIVAQVPDEPYDCFNVELVFPVTLQEYGRIYQSRGEAEELEPFIIEKVQNALQTAKRWREIVTSCYDFNWGDCFMSDILDEALQAIPEDEVPEEIRAGKRGHYLQRTIIVNHDTCFLQEDVPVDWVGYGHDGEKVADFAALLDMTCGDLYDMSPDGMRDKISRDVKSARIFFKDGSSIDLDEEDGFMKLCEDADSVHPD